MVYNKIAMGVGDITVYADILFLVNFSMDILTLYLACRLIGKPVSKFRLIISSALGSFFATVSSIMSHRSGIFTAIFGIAVSVVMTYIALGKYSSGAVLMRDSAIVWGAGVLLGGIMTFILSLGEPVYLDYGRDFTPAFTVCTALSILLTRLFTSRKTKKSVTVEITAAGERLSLTGLCDSGNMARDPFSSLPVIIVKKHSLGDLGTILGKEDCPLKLRMIPIEGIGGHTLMRGFVPDEVYIDGVRYAAVIASDAGDGSFAGHDAVVPAALCGR